MAVAEYTPSVDEIAAALPARTKNQWGTVGRFDATTRPSAEQVERRIQIVMGRFVIRLGDNLKTDALKEYAKETATYCIAANIELTFFSDQIDSRQSPYRELVSLCRDGWVALLDAVSDVNDDDDPDDGSIEGPGGKPLGWFDTRDELIGMKTEW